MGHAVREKTKLLGRVRRIRGQVEALERALDAEMDCAEVMMLVGSVERIVSPRPIQYQEGS